MDTAHTTLGTGSTGVNSFTVTHGLGYTPNGIIATAKTGNNTDTFSVKIHSITSTQFKVEVYRTDSAGASWGDSNFGIYWGAF